jgi:hypothetical protein
MPFTSKKQMGAAFGGYLGPEMQGKAKQWAAETPNPSSLPTYAKPSVGPRHVLRVKRAKPA